MICFQGRSSGNHWESQPCDHLQSHQPALRLVRERSVFSIYLCESKCVLYYSPVLDRRIAHTKAAAMEVSSTFDQAFKPTESSSNEFGFADTLKRDHKFGIDNDRPLCKSYLEGHCHLGDRCPDRHPVKNYHGTYVVAPPPLLSIQLLSLCPG